MKNKVQADHISEVIKALIIETEGRTRNRSPLFICNKVSPRLKIPVEHLLRTRYCTWAGDIETIEQYTYGFFASTNEVFVQAGEVFNGVKVYGTIPECNEARLEACYRMFEDLVLNEDMEIPVPVPVWPVTTGDYNDPRVVPDNYMWRERLTATYIRWLSTLLEESLGFKLCFSFGSDFRTPKYARCYLPREQAVRLKDMFPGVDNDQLIKAALTEHFGEPEKLLLVKEVCNLFLDDIGPKKIVELNY